jgi:Flavin containing amine oxidoreductase
VDIPETYEDNFQSFCEAHGLTDIMHWMDLPVTAFGYGDLSTIKTWYVLDYINVINFMGLSVLQILLGQSPVHKLLHGYGDLVDQMAHSLKNLRLSTPVTRIERKDGAVWITAADSDSKPERFDKVVLAAPLPDLKEALDLTPDEHTILDQIRTNTYVIAACELVGMPHDNYLLRFNANKAHFGHVALIERNLHGSAAELGVCYIPVIDSKKTLKSVLAELPKDLAKLGVTLKQVISSKEWSYFSHFMMGDAYERLEAMQGDNATYYVGGMAKFELAERVARDAQATMDGHFEGKRPKECFTTLKNLVWFYLRSVGPYT